MYTNYETENEDVFVLREPDVHYGDKDYIRFDWAMKRILRDKANFDVLEGFLTVLLNEKIRIKSMLESESNSETASEKCNRVDVLAENDRGALFIIEIQNSTDIAFFQRMLFATAKLVTQYMKKGKGYENVRKIYSINIVYFPLGQGTDTVYHGTTEFRGIHDGDILNLNSYQKQKFEAESIAKLYPEYYILKVNDFDKVAKTPLEEWLLYLKTGTVSDETKAPGLPEVRERLRVNRMTMPEQISYDKHVDDMVIYNSNLTMSREEGYFEGLEEGEEIGIVKGEEIGIVKGEEIGIVKGKEIGIAEGKKQSNIEMAKQMKADGLDLEFIVRYTNLSVEDLRNL